MKVLWAWLEFLLSTGLLLGLLTAPVWAGNDVTAYSEDDETVHRVAR